MVPSSFTCDPAYQEGKPDALFIPLVSSEVDREERPHPRLHVGDEENEPIEAKQRREGDFLVSVKRARLVSCLNWDSPDYSVLCQPLSRCKGQFENCSVPAFLVQEKACAVLWTRRAYD